MALLRLRQNQRREAILSLALVLILLFMRESPDTTKRDLGAGQTQTTRSGSSGMDAARAPSEHGCPFGAGPRSVVGVRVPDEVGPNREPETLGYLGLSSNSPKAKQFGR